MISKLSLDGLNLQVIVNGSLVRGLLRASIAASNCFSSDSYALTFAMGPLPLGDIGFWSTLSSAYVQISVNDERTTSSSNLICGIIDVIHVDPLQAIVSLEGRDLSASLVDSYRQQDFVNQTASEVVASIASFHGLTPFVTGTSGNVGRYYGDGYTRLSIGQFSRLRSDWDLVVQLARENSFDVFVDGTALLFQPPTSTDGLPVHIAFSDIKALRFEQNLAISSNATARVQTWNSQNMTAYVDNMADDGSDPLQTATSAGSQPYLFSASNLTSQQVTAASGQYAAELGRLGTVLHIEMPWDFALSPRTLILIDETDSPFDTIYRIDHIERHYSTTLGSHQVIRAVMSS